MRYTLHEGGGESSHDLDEILSLSFGEARRRWLTGYVSGRLAHRLDDIGRPDPFLSIPHTHGRSYQRLNAAYVDLSPRWRILETARLGRQWIPEIPEVVRMDGVRMETGALDPWLSSRAVLFGGIPDHISESERSQDRVFGGGLSLRPLDGTYLSACYARLKDVYRRAYVNASSRVSESDDLLSLELRQHLWGRAVNLYAGYTHLNGDSRDLRLRMSYESPSGRTGAHVTYRGLFSRQDTLSTELDPYVSVLRTYHPYHEVGFGLRQEFTEFLGAEAGASIRRLERNRDVGPFNHEFDRYYARATLRRWPLAGSELTVTGNAYDTGSDQLWEFEGAYAHTVRDRLRLALGSAYALYKEDRFTYEERNNVRSGFLRAEYDLTGDLSVRAEYALENDDDDTTHILEVGLKLRF